MFCTVLLCACLKCALVPTTVVDLQLHLIDSLSPCLMQPFVTDNERLHFSPFPCRCLRQDHAAHLAQDCGNKLNEIGDTSTLADPGIGAAAGQLRQVSMGHKRTRCAPTHPLCAVKQTKACAGWYGSEFKGAILLHKRRKELSVTVY